MSRHALKPYRREILLAAAAVALAVPGQADAQLMGRLKKAAAGAVADKAADAAARRVLGDSAAAAAESPAADAPSRGASARSSSTSASRAPEVLEITSARIDTFIVAMRPIVQAARDREAFAARQRKAKEWEECQARVMQSSAEAMARGTASAGPSEAAQKQIDALLDQSMALSEKMIAAGQAQDTQKQQFWADSMMVLNEKAMALQYPRVTKECGEKVVAPKEPTGEVGEDGRVISYTAPDRAATSGWTPTQFGRLRERLAIYLVAPDKASDLKPEERAAIDARRADLKPYADAFAAGTMEWKGWGDVWRGWK